MVLVVFICLTGHSFAADGPCYKPGADRGCESLSLEVLGRIPLRPFSVRLHFAEPDDVPPGQRVFNVKLQGRTVLKDFDVVREAGAGNRALVREFKGIRASDELALELIPKSEGLTKTTAPIIIGIEVVAE